MQDDPYSRVDYRRMVAWPERIRREAPFLQTVLAGIPARAVLDLGCGTGEHSRFMAQLGLRVLGVDRSQSMLDKALQEPCDHVDFAWGDLRHLQRLTEEQFGGAIALGNTLPHLKRSSEVRGFLTGLNRRLVPEGVFLFQILNYQRIFDQRIRYLPLNFRPEENGEVVFLRLMDLRENGFVLFCPCTLRFQPDQEEPVSVLRSKAIELRGWRQSDWIPLLNTSGFAVDSIYGDMEGNPYLPDSSPDLVMVAVKTAEL
jgi:SAM-dependent methyltransferase